MALLKLDEQNMVLNVIAGTLEEYKPTDAIRMLSAKVLEIQAKLRDFQAKENDFLMTEIKPVLEQVRQEVIVLNETTYPELKKMREQREQEELAKKPQ